MTSAADRRRDELLIVTEVAERLGVLRGGLQARALGPTSPLTHGNEWCIDGARVRGADDGGCTGEDGLALLDAAGG